MKSFVAAVFLIACLVEFTLAFIFFVPVQELRWLGFVSMVMNFIGVYLAWSVIAAKR